MDAGHRRQTYVIKRNAPDTLATAEIAMKYSIGTFLPKTF